MIHFCNLQKTKKDLEKCKSDLEKTKNDLDSQNLNLRKHITKSLETEINMESEIRVQKLKVEGAERCISTLKSEIAQVNESHREKLKIIREQESTINKLNSEITTP